VKNLNSLFLVFISLNAISQVKINGKILSNKNIPLAGVNISIVDSTTKPPPTPLAIFFYYFGKRTAYFESYFCRF
jgi:hypothetical protein